MIDSLMDIPGIKEHVREGTRYERLHGPPQEYQIPNFDAPLWRYMDFTRFISLLENRALFFARADCLGDPFEGAWPETNHRIVQLSKGGALPSNWKADAMWWDILTSNASDLRRFVLINCWHESANESEAMWKLYAGEGRGVAVKTDFKSLVHSFTDRIPDMIANVRYLSYETGTVPWTLLAPFLSKRSGFAHEREVRAIIPHLNFQPTGEVNVKAIDFSSDVCDVGMCFPVDLGDLIHEVVVGPYAQSWLFDLVQQVCVRYGISVPIRLSNMAKDPIW